MVLLATSGTYLDGGLWFCPRAVPGCGNLSPHPHPWLPLPSRHRRHRGRHLGAKVRERLNDEVAEFEQSPDLILKFLWEVDEFIRIGEAQSTC